MDDFNWSILSPSIRLKQIVIRPYSGAKGTWPVVAGQCDIYTDRPKLVKSLIFFLYLLNLMKLSFKHRIRYNLFHMKLIFF